MCTGQYLQKQQKTVRQLKGLSHADGMQEHRWKHLDWKQSQYIKQADDLRYMCHILH